MAEAVVSVALQTIGDLLLDGGKFLLGEEGTVKALQRQLKEMKCLLKDAHSKQHQSASVRNWMAEIRDLTYRAEDAIAVYAVESSSLLPIYSRYKLRSEISGIMSEIATITNNMQNYGIRSIVDGAESSTAGDNLNWRRKTFPNFHIEDCFVGKEEELKQLVSLLVDDEHHRIISIWGMGGIGKTTIAKKVYNQMIEANCFESFAWVCISQQCRIRSVLEDVLKQLNTEKVEGVSSLSETQLIEQLCHIQRAKRCLIVLDDLWETCHWDGFKHAFLVRNLKSKILVTTRKQDIAKIGFPLQLGFLNMDDAWELLKKKTFPHGNIPVFASQECEDGRLGKEMVRRCGCLPLAISLLGGILSKKNSMKEWELVNENMHASLYRGEGHHGEDNQLDGVLNLSYEDLPYYLKLCFLYLGVLKEDASIGVGVLYRMWIAQGLISYENSRGNEASLMEVAELYLSELASRSIVQVEVDDENPTKKFKKCKLHDVVRELCLSMGQKEYNSVQILEYKGGSFSALLHNALSRIRTRHLVIYFKTELQVDDEVTVIGEEDNYKHLRSLHIHNDTNGRTNIEFPSTVGIRKFKSLRSLELVRFKFVGGKLPRGITDLVHLRHLSLRYCEIDELPSSISNLVYLDTLDLNLSRNVRIPNVLKKMFRLTHLFLPRYDKEIIGNYRLRLDEGLDQLESLMELNTSVHKFGRLTRMTKLQRFSAYIHDNESFSAILNVISTNWNKLVNCFVKVEEGCCITLTELKKAFTCRNLYTLAINVHLRLLLTECRRIDIIGSNLISLYLSKCEIEEDPMEILGKLPSLAELIFLSKSFVGEEMTCPAFSFPRLKVIKLDKLPQLREWRVEQGGMPLLSRIYICHCPRLEMVPEGLSGISTLQKLAIIGMPELGKRVLASGGDSGGGEGEDFHKVRHVRSIKITN